MKNSRRYDVPFLVLGFVLLLFFPYFGDLLYAALAVEFLLFFCVFGWSIKPKMWWWIPFIIVFFYAGAWYSFENTDWCVNLAPINMYSPDNVKPMCFGLWYEEAGRPNWNPMTMGGYPTVGSLEGAYSCYPLNWLFMEVVPDCQSWYKSPAFFLPEGYRVRAVFLEGTARLLLSIPITIFMLWFSVSVNYIGVMDGSSQTMFGENVDLFLAFTFLIGVSWLVLISK